MKQYRLHKLLFVITLTVFSFINFIMGGTITVVNVKDHGAIGDGITDDTKAIQNAYNYGVKNGINRLYFPATSASYRITAPLNFTNRGERPLIIEGDGMSLNGPNFSAVLGQTGDWIVDFTGSQFVEIKNIKFYSSGAKASTFGLLFSRSTLHKYAMYIYLYRVFVDIASSPKASTVGSIAVVNNAAEDYIVEHCWFSADTAYAGMMANELKLKSPYTTIGTVLSSTLMNFRNTVFIAKKYSGTILYGVMNVFFDKCYWDLAPGNKSNYAIILRPSNRSYSSCRVIKFTGQVEKFPSIAYLDSDTYDINFDLLAINSSQAYIQGRAKTSHHNLQVNIHQVNGKPQQILASAGPTMNLFGGELTVYPGMHISNTNIKLLGTIIKGGKYDGKLISVAADSSYTYHSYNSTLRKNFNWNPKIVQKLNTVVSPPIKVPGAALGDTVQVFPPYTMQGCIAYAYVSEANTVRVIISNISGSAKTFSSNANWKVKISKY